MPLSQAIYSTFSACKIGSLSDLVLGCLTFSRGERDSYPVAGNLYLRWCLGLSHLWTHQCPYPQLTCAVSLLHQHLLELAELAGAFRSLLQGVFLLLHIQVWLLATRVAQLRVLEAMLFHLSHQGLWGLQAL